MPVETRSRARLHKHEIFFHETLTKPIKRQLTWAQNEIMKKLNKQNEMNIKSGVSEEIINQTNQTALVQLNTTAPPVIGEIKFRRVCDSNQWHAVNIKPHEFIDLVTCPSVSDINLDEIMMGPDDE